MSMRTVICAQRVIGWTLRDGKPAAIFGPAPEVAAPANECHGKSREGMYRCTRCGQTGHPFSTRVVECAAVEAPVRP